MTAPDEPTQQLPPVPPERPSDRRGPAIIAGTGLALVAGIVVWAIVASSGDDGSVSIGPDTTPRTDTTATSAPAPTAPTTLAPPPTVVLVPTTAVTPGSVVVVPTAPPATTSPSPPTTDGPSTSSPTSTPTTRPKPDIATITAALTEALLGPDYEPPAQPVVRVTVGRRQVRVTWRIGNEDDLEAARTGAYDEAARMLGSMASFSELEGRRTVLDGTYPLPNDDGTTRTRRVIRLVFEDGTLDGVDVGGLDPAALVALADQAVINPAFAV